MMHYYYGSIFGWGGGFVMTLLLILLVVFLIMAISGAGHRQHYYKNWRNPDDSDPGKPGLGILNERYARGEITKEEYEQKKKDILA